MLNFNSDAGGSRTQPCAIFTHTQLRTDFSAADDDESDDTCAGLAGELGVMRSVPSVATWFILISGKI